MKETMDLIEEYEEDVSVFINGLTADKKEQEILRFFSINSLNDKSLKAACDKFNVTQDCINGTLVSLRMNLDSKIDIYKYLKQVKYEFDTWNYYEQLSVLLSTLHKCFLKFIIWTQFGHNYGVL